MTIKAIKQRLSVLDDRQRELDQIIEREKRLKDVKDTNVIHFHRWSIFDYPIGRVSISSAIKKVVRNPIQVTLINVSFECQREKDS